ncbi:hypothetical protein Pnap_0385 [Polaromonas naphthalenivorans CJ2]|uniref:Uncharacterized protein n=1 Tax=Polaromonas naphthalenivorans (strain CJ2) TaxID=365044 RepID=A1VJ80_POLNA|nr:hypothetical protein Pnap_0385 [Polaromonas naphthalenivorans CJ2]
MPCPAGAKVRSTAALLVYEADRLAINKIAASAYAASTKSRFSLKNQPRTASTQRKHRLQRRQQLLQRRRMHGTQALHQPHLVQRA